MKLLWMFIVHVHCSASFFEYCYTLYLYYSFVRALISQIFLSNTTASIMFKVLDNNKYVSSLAIPQKVADMITI